MSHQAYGVSVGISNNMENTLAFGIKKKQRWIFFAAKDGEAVYSQKKQDLELTVAQTMNSLLPNSDLN